jgi:hypothetical protein
MRDETRRPQDALDGHSLNGNGAALT